VDLTIYLTIVRFLKLFTICLSTYLDPQIKVPTKVNNFTVT